jgi:hypothetical protein
MVSGMFTDGQFYAASFSPTGVLKPRVSKIGFELAYLILIEDSTQHLATAGMEQPSFSS